jgi:hypothetical protein
VLEAARGRLDVHANISPTHQGHVRLHDKAQLPDTRNQTKSGGKRSKTTRDAILQLSRMFYSSQASACTQGRDSPIFKNYS